MSQERGLQILKSWRFSLCFYNWEVADNITHQELSSLLETPKQIFNRILMYFEHKYFSYV